VSGPSALLDTNIFVSARNPSEAGHSACRRLLDGVDDGRFRALVSTITIAEIRAGLEPGEARTVWQAFVSHLLTSPNYAVESVDTSIAEAGGEMRERTKLPLPDALILATAKLRGAAFVVSQDRQLGRLQSMIAVRTPQEIR
jgi:predicted nucleic acid-binding protein